MVARPNPSTVTRDPELQMIFQLTLRVAARKIQSVGFILHIKVADTLVGGFRFNIVGKCCRNSLSLKD
jgi:hypothetical protein